MLPDTPLDERPDAPATELSGQPVTRFKNAKADRIRKQAARFRVFQSDNAVDWIPAQLPPGATVQWQVTLANKKAAIDRPALVKTILNGYGHIGNDQPVPPGHRFLNSLDRKASFTMRSSSE